MGRGGCKGSCCFLCGFRRGAMRMFWRSAACADGRRACHCFAPVQPAAARRRAGSAAAGSAGAGATTGGEDSGGGEGEDLSMALVLHPDHLPGAQRGRRRRRTAGAGGGGGEGGTPRRRRRRRSRSEEGGDSEFDAGAEEGAIRRRRRGGRAPSAKTLEKRRRREMRKAEEAALKEAGLAVVVSRGGEVGLGGRGTDEGEVRWGRGCAGRRGCLDANSLCTPAVCRAL